MTTLPQVVTELNKLDNRLHKLEQGASVSVKVEIAALRETLRKQQVALLTIQNTTKLCQLVTHLNESHINV